VEAEVVRGYGADVVEVLRDFVVDDRKPERATGRNCGIEVHWKRGAWESSQGTRRGEATQEFTTRKQHPFLLRRKQQRSV
jgi:hypothetical protein